MGFPSFPQTPSPLIAVEKYHRRPSGHLVSTMISVPQARGGAIRIRWSARALKRIAFIITILVMFCICLNFRHRILNEKRPKAGDVGMLGNEKYSTVPPESVMGFAIGDSQPEHSEAELNVLGFEKVYVISMPERQNTLTGFAMAANVTGFDFEVVDGRARDVDEEEAAAERLLRAGHSSRSGRYRQGKEEARRAAKEAWFRRSHLNAARWMVAEDVETALIFEDDADWDVNLREQLELFAVGSGLLLQPQSKRVRGMMRELPRSPYGDGWDMLWFGHCGMQPLPDDSRRFVIRNDYTVPPYVHRYIPEGDLERETKRKIDESTRMVYRTGSGSCLYAYALSLKGARKLLSHLDGGTVALPLDTGYSRLCQFPVYGFKCIGVYPQLIDRVHLKMRSVNSDSGKLQGGLNAPQTSGKLSWNIEYSMRQNAGNMRAGRRVISHWPDGKEMPREKDVKTVFLDGTEPDTSAS